MKTALLRCHTEEYEGISRVSLDSAVQFAQRNGMLFVEGKILPFERFPHMSKIGRLIDLLECGLDSILYADVDVVFRQNQIYNLLWGESITMSVDHAGWCTGFFHVTKASLDVLRLWKMMGPANYNGHKLDQGSFRLMVDNLPWVFSQVVAIPESVVSNPESNHKGTIAHHFWANCFPNNRLMFEDMKQFAKEQE